MKENSQKGFTLIELLIVVAIIAALAIAIFAGLNPAKRLLDARNAKRTADVDSILTAIHEYIIDNAGSYPWTGGAPFGPKMLGTGATCTNASTSDLCNTPAQCIDLSTNLAKYLKNIPIDPSAGTAAKTGYAISSNQYGVVSIAACSSEGSPVASISASR
jgi:prepilin-type N-terminal cleavage/methylation domain-containing protein